ncbi:MAG: hypothetical protein ACFFCW_12930 [Candidatus Hodarchaeota archaeon]
MTNRLHRWGKAEDRLDDFVIFCTAEKDINYEGKAKAFKEFFKIIEKYKPLQFGYEVRDVMLQDLDYTAKYEKVLEVIGVNTPQVGEISAVFDNFDNLKEAVKEIVKADLGLCVNICGLPDKVEECCRYAGMNMHSIESSLGFVGQIDMLPSRDILELATMCGHGMVSFSLVTEIVDLIKKGKIKLEKGCELLRKPCHCGAINSTKAMRTFKKYIEKEDKKTQLK